MVGRQLVAQEFKPVVFCRHLRAQDFKQVVACRQLVAQDLETVVVCRQLVELRDERRWLWFRVPRTVEFDLFSLE